MAQPRRIHFHVSLLTVIFLVVVAFAIGTVAMVIAVSGRSIRTTIEERFTSVSELGQARVETLITEARTATATAAHFTGNPGDGDTTTVIDPLGHPAYQLFKTHLDVSPRLYSIYVGYDDGSFFQVIRTRSDPAILSVHEAPPQTAYILRSIDRSVTNGTRQEEWRFIADDGALIAGRSEGEVSYDPRERPWYQTGAYSDNQVQTSSVYEFNSLSALGVTLSRRLITEDGTIGVDITLDSIDRFFREYAISTNGGLLIADSAGRVLAGNDTLLRALGIDPTDTLPTLPDSTPTEGIDAFDLQNEAWFVQRTTVDGMSESGDSGGWTIVLGAPHSDFLAPFSQIRRQVILFAVIILLIAAPVGYVVARTSARVLHTLAEEAQRIRDLDFEASPPINTRIVEFHHLATGFYEMKARLYTRTRELNASLDRLAKIIELNIAISAEQNIDRLSELILQGARELSHADGGSMYLKNEETHALDFMIVLNDSLGFAQGGTSDNDVLLPPVPLYGADDQPNEHNVVSYSVLREETVNIPDAYNAVGFDFSGTRRFDEANGYRTQSILTVPLKPRGSDIIGAIQLLNAKDPDTGETVEFSDEIQRFVEALAAGAATALYNRDLIEEQRRLFDAMIQLIAGAIDAKSPYTGGHCARVPEIALMLARKANATSEGPLAPFQFNDDQDWRAFRIGAWLHDAGKVTTPDYVVDKATKLETIYNRIHEIRTRFEVLLRDARIARHEAVLAGADPNDEDEKLAKEERTLQEEFEFIAECNVGGEFLAPEKLERLKEIARREWTRYFDDSIGLSWSEQQRRDGLPPSPTPTRETLLADRPDHIIPRTNDFYQQYEKYGFTIPVPKHLYNLGELYNLSVSRGTLTEEERFKINEHVMQTIVMLDRLPFPRTLGNVPEYAGTHHEALNGSGYPKQLTGDDLSIPARIMAIADIFEALTASDRPYKKAKPLSIAIDILAKFKEEGHIDPDLFDLFLESGIYREYAEAYLRPEQLDDVNISKYVG